MSLMELTSAYNKVLEYYDKLKDEEKTLLTLDVDSSSISFHDEGIVPSINLCNDLNRVPEYCSGTNKGLLLCCRLSRHELEHAEQYIADLNNEHETVQKTFMEKWNDGKQLHSFIISHRQEYVKIISKDILKLFGIDSAYIIQIMKENPQRQRFNLLFIVRCARTNEYIIKILKEIEYSQILAHSKLPACSSLVGGRKIKVKELINFMSKAIVTLMDYVSKEDLLKFMIAYEDASL